MKKFFMTTPQQPEGNLRSQTYEPVGNSLLAFGETCFPIIPVMKGYLEEGDAAQLITVTYDSADCHRNLESLRNEVEAVCAAKNASCSIESIEAPFDDSVTAVIHVFQELINHTDNDDELYACITFGSKPMPIALIMALQYAYRIKDNAYIECVVYGQLDHGSTPPVAKIYDITALVQLDEIVRLLANQGVENPEAAINAIIGG